MGDNVEDLRIAWRHFFAHETSPGQIAVDRAGPIQLCPEVDENEINHVVAIIDSMTPRERDNHMIINGSRRRRIARGSGTSVQEVNQLLKQYAQAKKMMKSLSGNLGFLGKKMGKMGLGKLGLPGF